MRRKTIVLGTELAAALDAEERRLARGVTAPPLLPTERYDPERGDYNLVAASPSKLDLDIRDITKEIQSWDSGHWNSARQTLSFDDQYTLINFAMRSAVFALNSEPLEWCRSGLVALSLLDETRIDPRDAWWASGLLQHSISTIPGIREQLLGDESRFASSILSRALVNSNGKFTLAEWGYAAIRTAGGVGLLKCGRARYQPHIGLTDVALKISENLSSGRYVAEVEIASKVPEIWFAADRRAEARISLDRAYGVASIHGTLRRTYDSQANQMLMAWVAEMPSTTDCEHLVADVGAGKNLSERHSVGISEGRLFALLVAGSFQEGIEPFETRDSLGSLTEIFREAMREVSG